MKDVQNEPDTRGIPLRAGIKGFQAKITLRDKNLNVQHCDAMIDVFADLPATQKGAHMSRFPICINDHLHEIHQDGLKRLLKDLSERMNSSHTGVLVKFNYAIPYSSPKKAIKSSKVYACQFFAEYKDNKYDFHIKIRLPIMTVCPCSLAMSDNGEAHSQRAYLDVDFQTDEFVWIEDIIETVESVVTPVHPILKRPDEKELVARGFANAHFAEDATREAYVALIAVFPENEIGVSCETLESIHAHNAYAEVL